MNQKSKKTTSAKAKTDKPDESEPIMPEEQGMIKAGPAQKAAPRKLFEFYRSVDDSITDMKGWYRVSLLDPPHQYATCDTLARVCETTYGPGNFVALEVRATTEGPPQGLPHSYWVIKVRHGRRRPTFKEVIPPDEMLKHHRQTQRFMPASDEDKQREREAIAKQPERQPEATEEEGGELFKLEGRPYLSAFSLDGDVEKVQRGAEASLVAALGLPTLPEPEFKEETPHEYVRRRYAEKAKRKEIAIELMEKYSHLKTDYDQAVSICRNALRPKQKARKIKRDKQTNAAKKAPTRSGTKSRSKKK